jgi:hypothetical protein
VFGPVKKQKNKLMKKILNLTLLIISVPLFSCAEKITGNKLNIKVDPVKTYAWLNLMPGGKPSFHLSADIKIKNNSNVPVTNLTLHQIVVYEDTNKIEGFKPVFVNRKDDSDNNFIPGEVKDFSITAPDRVNFEKLYKLKEINLLLQFSSGDKMFEYMINNVKIERVY